MAKVPTPVNMMAEYGDTGLRRYSGYVRDEFLKQLTGSRGAEVYREMRDNDAIIGGVMYAIEQILRNVDWSVEAANDTEEAKAVAEFVHQCLYDMERTWDEVVTEILTFPTFGWCLQELVYCMRYHERGSGYDDGLIRWKKMPTRAQETLFKWEFTEHGEPIGFYQIPYVGRGIRYIPKDKYVLFRTTTAKDNPEGRSILRNAYVSWYYKKHIQNIESIGIERDMAGIPFMTVPAEIMSSDASDEQKALFSKLSQIIRNVKRNEDEGIIFPSDTDDNGNKLYDLKLMAASGNRQFNTNEIIGRYDLRIAQSVLADFIMLGHEKVGSFALSSDKTDKFAMSLGAILKQIENPMNQQAIPRLLVANGVPRDLYPELKAGDIESRSLREIGDFIDAIVGSGAVRPDETLEDFLRAQIGLNKPAGRTAEMGFEENDSEMGVRDNAPRRTEKQLPLDLGDE